jgi:hypothetical protein
MVQGAATRLEIILGYKCKRKNDGKPRLTKGLLSILDSKLRVRRREKGWVVSPEYCLSLGSIL